MLHVVNPSEGEGRGGTEEPSPLFPRYSWLIPLLLAASTAVCLHLWGPITGDSDRYLRLGANLAAGHGFSAARQPPFSPESFRAPLYPLLLAATQAAHLGIYGAIGLQLAAYLAGIWLTVRIAARLGLSGRTQQLAAVILALHPGMVRWMSSITAESLCLLLFTTLALCVVCFVQRPALPAAAGIGLMVALLFLTRAEFIVLVGLIAALPLFSRDRPAALRGVMLALAIAVVIPGAWMLRNLRVIPGLHPVGVGGGMTLWVRSVELREPDIAARSSWLENPNFHEIHYGSDPIRMAAADEALLGEAREVISQHRGPYLLGAVGKLFYREWVEVYSPGLPQVMLWAALLVSTGLLVTAYLGMWWTVPQRPSLAWPLLLACLLIALTHALGGTEARYTTPLRPVLYLFSAAAICGMFHSGVGRRKSWDPKRITVD